MPCLVFIVITCNRLVWHYSLWLYHWIYAFLSITWKNFTSAMLKHAYLYFYENWNKNFFSEFGWIKYWQMVSNSQNSAKFFSAINLCNTVHRIYRRSALVIHMHIILVKIFQLFRVAFTEIKLTKVKKYQWSNIIINGMSI